MSFLIPKNTNALIIYVTKQLIKIKQLPRGILSQPFESFIETKKKTKNELNKQINIIVPTKYDNFLFFYLIRQYTVSIITTATHILNVKIDSSKLIMCAKIINEPKNTKLDKIYAVLKYFLGFIIITIIKIPK